jgi:O-antigen/teichoic acid export membrane protein
MWNFIGCTAGTMKNQGVNIAINLFTGPAVNAARGIAMQINGIVSRFIQNFTIALNPQIIKDYAAGNLERMHKLIFTGTRFSYFLFMFLSIPIFFEVESILKVWLGQVPAHTVLFTRLVLILTLAEIISQTLITAQAATGKIRNYQIVVGGILLLNFPISYLLLYLGFAPEITLVVAIIISQICLAARLWFLKSMVKLPVTEFIKTVYIKVIAVTILAVIPPFFCYWFMQPSIARFLLVGTVSVISSFVFIYFIGCNKSERKKIMNTATKLKRKILHR